MAFDRLIDSAKLDAAVTATADAIREVSQMSDKITWNESTGFANAVRASIHPPFEVGTIIPASDNTKLIVYHNLGVVPTFAFYAAEKQHPTDQHEAFMGYAFTAAEVFENIALRNAGYTSVYVPNRSQADETGQTQVNGGVRPMTEADGIGNAFALATDKSIILCSPSSFKAGQKYIYVLVGVAI